MANGTEYRANLAPRFPLSVFLVEDNAADAELCVELLLKAQFGVQFDVADTAKEFVELLRTKNYDVILADYHLEYWTGMDALDLLHKEGRDIPFILVTGALGDQRAVECIERGISDYVLKDRMERLPSAIHRALEQKALRSERQQAERSLEESEAKFRALADAIPTAVFVEQGTRCCYANRAAERITGYSREELLAINFWRLMLLSSRKALVERASDRLDADQSASRYETRILAKDGKMLRLDVTVGMFQHEGGLAALITALDITERKRTGDESLEAASGECKWARPLALSA